mmetsp:Transcript_6786/g.19649  ORF Transcript_6786/g.19649 Transcript_6786/m.19649 type:complete len:330 (-) Transcript_6786:144-1133(-)
MGVVRTRTGLFGAVALGLVATATPLRLGGSHLLVAARMPWGTRSALRMAGSTAEDDEIFAPGELDARVEAMKEEAAAPLEEEKPKKQKGFWEAFDETVWDLFQGRKEKIWAPDRRPEDERGPYDKSKSTLSWGDETKVDEALFQPLAPSSDPKKVAATETPVVGLANQGSLPMQEAESKNDDVNLELSERLKRLEIESVVPDGPERFLEGRQLAELCFAKYGRYHDMALLRNTGQIGFNIYGPGLGDRRGFGYTEEQYLQKLDTVCAMLNDFDQAWYVREFLLEPIYPRRGLPSTPRADTAVTLRLNTSPTWRFVDEDKVEEWFTLFRG